MSRRPRATATGGSVIDPHYFGFTPCRPSTGPLAKAGKSFDDLSVLELNEAFTAQVLGRVAEWPEFDPAVLDPQGGAIAWGHPLGGVGVATLCSGVGRGLAVALVLER